MDVRKGCDGRRATSSGRVWLRKAPRGPIQPALQTGKHLLAVPFLARYFMPFCLTDGCLLGDIKGDGPEGDSLVHILCFRDA